MRTAIITGASRGLGLALTRALVGDGWQVVVDGRDERRLRAATDPLGPAVHAIAGDITDPAHRLDLVSAAWDLGGLELLVNNASDLGPSPLPHLRHYDLDRLAQVYRVNVLGPLGLLQEALPLLATAGGAVVNVTSDAAVEDYEAWGGYGSSKAALEQLSHILAAEEPGVRVWWVDPGDMRTQMHQDAFPGEDISDRPEPETVVPAFLRLLAERPPSGRIRAGDLLAAAPAAPNAGAVAR
jgi:NAD(P)-dependent dehydrogenase (short-subunit alcohol dehydrogenase family)